MMDGRAGPKVKAHGLGYNQLDQQLEVVEAESGAQAAPFICRQCSFFGGLVWCLLVRSVGASVGGFICV